MISLPVWFYFALAGVVGGGSRLAIQGYRDDGYDGTWVRIVSLLFLACVSGWVAWLIDPSYLSSVSLGFMAPDVIENLFAKFAPEG